MRFTISATPG